ncbi:MAG: DUF2442 domain-containing protein [Spirochaetales bacterium]|nr:DUF2442 domain-containing protein [Spirochaetales bacterium]
MYQVIPQDDYTVVLFYDNGEIKPYDCSWIQSESGVFERINDISRFKKLCTVMNGTPIPVSISVLIPSIRRAVKSILHSASGFPIFTYRPLSRLVE